MPFCPNCGRELAPDTAFCQYCGYNLSGGIPGSGPGPAPSQQQWYGPQVPPKDPTVAVLLALVLGFFGIFGIGHIYVGQLVRGIIFLVTGIALAFLVVVGSFFLVCGLPFLIIGFVVWIFQAIDAHRLANEYNDVLRRTGRPPW